MDLESIQQIFFQECEEGLASMEVSFSALRRGEADGETINSVFRCVHSIKGGAGAFGHERLQGYTHEYETLLDLMRNGTLTLSDALLDVVVAAYDMLSDHVAAARDHGEAPADAAMLAKLVAAANGAGAAPVPAAVAAAEPAVDVGGGVAGLADFDDLMALLEDDAPAAAKGTSDPDAGWTLIYQPTAGALAHGAEPLLLLRELAMLGGTVTMCDRAAVPTLDAMDPECAYLGWTVVLPEEVAGGDIRDIFEFTDACAVTLTHNATPAGDALADDPLAGDFGADLLEPAHVPDLPMAAPAAAPAPVDPTPAPTKAFSTFAPTAPAPAPNAAAPNGAAKATPVPAPAQTIRVDLDKLDRLVNLVGELVITQAMLAQRLLENGMGGTSELSDLENLTRELQDSTMAIRAQPLKTVFSRVPRIIRELETETGKRVRLDVEGEMTEVDKTVVERIGEPLTHLIRNAVDHGLEMPDERVAVGKPAEGVVRLSAVHHSSRIVITVADDGKGIDRTRVRAKAIERGIVHPDAVLSDEDVDNLIFAPGFSTAATLSNISGRGVGMDVVRKNIQALGGRIGIQSREGAGSSFSLSLPLTLAVVDGMIVTVGGQTFVIPLSHIVESLRPDFRNLSPFGRDGQVLDVRGAYVPVLPVADDLGIVEAERDPTKAVLIVVEGAQGQAALLVDTIQDQRQVVVKSLEANYQAIDGLAGATILGDGRVALILDVDALTARSRLPGAPSLASAA